MTFEEIKANCDRIEAGVFDPQNATPLELVRLMAVSIRALAEKLERTLEVNELWSGE